MGDASKRRRLLMVAAVVVAVLAGVGAAAQAGLLSRAESNGDGTSRGAGAAIADPSGNGNDVVAVSESTANVDEGGQGHSSAAPLRVGNTIVGEAPLGESNPLSDALGDQAEMITDVGCNDGPDNLTQSCISLLHSYRGEDEGYAEAYMAGVEFYTPMTGFNVLLESGAYQDVCYGGAYGAVAYGDLLDQIDVSQENSNGCDN